MSFIVDVVSSSHTATAAAATNSQRRCSNRFGARRLQPLMPLALMMLLLLPACQSTADSQAQVAEPTVAPIDADNEIPANSVEQSIASSSDMLTHDFEEKQDEKPAENYLDQYELSSTLKSVSNSIIDQPLGEETMPSNEISEPEKMIPKLSTIPSVTTTEAVHMTDPLEEEHLHSLENVPDPSLSNASAENEKQPNHDGNEQEEEGSLNSIGHGTITKESPELHSMENKQEILSAFEEASAEKNLNVSDDIDRSGTENENTSNTIENEPVSEEQQQLDVEAAGREVTIPPAVPDALGKQNESTSNTIKDDAVSGEKQHLDAEDGETEITIAPAVTDKSENWDESTRDTVKNEELSVDKQTLDVVDVEREVKLAAVSTEKFTPLLEKELEESQSSTEQPVRTDNLSITLQESLTATEQEREVKNAHVLDGNDSQPNEQDDGYISDLNVIAPTLPPPDRTADINEDNNELERHILEHSVIKKQGVELNEVPEDVDEEEEKFAANTMTPLAVEDEEPTTVVVTAHKVETGTESETSVENEDEAAIKSELDERNKDDRNSEMDSEPVSIDLAEPKLEVSSHKETTTEDAVPPETTTYAADDDSDTYQETEDDPIVSTQTQTKESEGSISVKESRSISKHESPVARSFEAVPPPDAGQTFNDNLAAETAGEEILGKALPTRSAGYGLTNRSVAIILVCSSTALLFFIISVTMFLISFQRQHGTLDIEMQERRCGKDDGDEDSEGAARIQLLDVELPPPQAATSTDAMINVASADEEPDECL